jgi:uncharacterized protein (TIGR02246 family)
LRSSLACRLIPTHASKEIDMTEDERAIRQVIDTWTEASRAGDTATVLSLMTHDVVFMIPGREPFGREVFAAAANAPNGQRVEGSNEVVELQILGDWAFVRNRLDLTVTSPNGDASRRSGYTLTLFRKDADGCWRLARDANLLAQKG